MNERYVVLGLSRTREGWFSALGRWSAAGSIPVEFVRCVSVEQLRAQLAGTRRYSAVVVDASASGLDRDLVACAADVDCAVIVVDADPARQWDDIGVSAVLAPVFSRDELLAVLGATTSMLGAASEQPTRSRASEPDDEGVLVAVTGPGGTGASACAMALAQGLAGVADTSRLPVRRRRAVARRSVLLADLCRVADQAMFHDARTLAPGVQELVEAHRTADPPASLVREQTFEVAARGYRLLLGLRRARHWTSLRPRAVEATIDSLRRAAQVTVGDVEVDAEGEAETGSVEVEDRHTLARATFARADVVVVVGEPSMKGIHALVRAISELVDTGVPLERVLPVVNFASRSPRARMAASAAIDELLATRDEPASCARPLHLPRRALDGVLRDGLPLPAELAGPLAERVTSMCEVLGARPPSDDSVPVPLPPGSLAGLSDTA